MSEGSNEAAHVHAWRDSGFADIEDCACGEHQTTPRLQRRLYEGEKRAGWDPENANTLAEEIAHLHEEISEAFRAFRLTKDCALTLDANGKPQGVPAELADAAIGMFYIAERWGFNLLSAVETKHRYNLTRSYATEGRRLHDLTTPPGAST